MWPELLEDYKRYVDIYEEDLDETLTLVLEFAEEFIYANYNISIFDRTITEPLRGTYGMYLLYTSKGVIREIDNLVIDDQVVLPTNLKFHLNSITVRDLTVVISQYSDIEITYSVGYENYADVPKALVNALFILAKKLFNDARKDTDTLTSISLDIKESIRVLEDIPVMAKQSLEPYRVYRI